MAPEMLCKNPSYSYASDIWALGCVFFEIVTLFPLFPGDNELDQINKIHNIRAISRGSLNKIIPQIAAPTAPMPVQIA